MYFVTGAMSINTIEGKSHKLELKSSTKYLTNHVVKITLLVLGVYTHARIHIRMKEISKNQTPTWFENSSLAMQHYIWLAVFQSVSHMLGQFREHIQTLLITA